MNDNGAIDALLTTINISKGVISSMGFGAITIENFDAIIKRLFSDSIPVEINPVALKSLFIYYLKKSELKETQVPYELIVWKKLLNDIREINYDISEFINSKLDIMNLTEAKVKKFINAKISETWFYSPGQNKYIDEIVENIEKTY